MQRRFILIIITIVLVSLMGHPPASEAATITVNGTTCTLLDAVIAAESNTASGGCIAGGPGPSTDTIVLDADTNLTAEYASSTPFFGDKAGLPDITTNIIIQAGTADTINGDSSTFRILNVAGGNLTLDGVTVSGGAVSTAGGGIYVNDTGTLTLTNATITNNSVAGSADGAGGGIYNLGTITAITNSTISNNTAQPAINSGDGYTAYGGGIYNDGIISSIDGGTIISGNRADGGDSSGINGGVGLGGGIFTTVAIDFDTVTLTANHASGGDGTQNGAEASGGGYYGDLSGTNTGLTVTNNTATGGDGPNGVGIATGGGIYVKTAISGIDLSTFSGNAATGGSGADAYGGGIFATPSSGSPVVFDQVLFESNTATGGDSTGFAGSGVGGGIVINNGPAVTFTDSTIRLNTSAGGTGSPAGQGSGGGLYVGSLAGLVTIDSSTINNNTATDGSGGGILASGPTTIVNSTISGNTATSFGGGVYFTANSNSMTVQFSTFLNNTAGTGEGVYLFGTNLSMTGSVIASAGAAVDCFGVDSIAANITNVKLLGDNSCVNIAPKNIEIDVQIDSVLQNNGGLTDTHAIIGGPDNNAINNVPSCGLSFDQRGEPRDTVCDAGSYEIPTTPMVVDSVDCVGPDLEVIISGGDGPFTIDASAGINVPVNVGTGTHTILGPEKWDNLSVQETDGDGEAVNYGQFKCRTDERPDPIWPPHRYHTTNPHPYFSWTAVSFANNYRVFVFDDANAATRTVDIRENSGGPTDLTLSATLPDGRVFWRVRGRTNRVWGLWSVRFTLFKDPDVFTLNDNPGPVIEMPTTPIPSEAPPSVQPPNDEGRPPAMPTPPSEETPQVEPPNSR